MNINLNIKSNNDLIYIIFIFDNNVQSFKLFKNIYIHTLLQRSFILKYLQTIYKYIYIIYLLSINKY